ncbi:uncharacterized protein LOC125178954 [Hyalella azteca]|uniref:Uncharacterized protein LOC125178954 n=1 Tax=Hyalella azteca TaxID=294128 RepID=A0A979FUU0_HYAAZ|nr:uncharacterized protein LOC125178954 [Hyalella azteca]
MACLDLCRGFTLCVGFSYNGVSCELRDTASILTASTGWVTYLITQQPDLPLQDPCASSPCPATKACIRYMIPAKVPYHPEWALNFSMPGYFCSSAPLLLAQRDQGKRCQFIMHENVNLAYYDIRMVNAPFYEAFDLCSNANCTSMIIIHRGTTGFPELYFKNSAPFFGPWIDPMPVTSDIFIGWFPECA